MNAPSEKHLEDYLWEHPEALGWIWDMPEEYGDIPEGCEDAPIFNFQWRQLKMPSGIVDLVGTSWVNELAIVELKRGPIDTEALAQVLRYMRDFQTMLDEGLRLYYENNGPYRDHMARHPLTDGDWYDILLKGVLIGRPVKDPHLLIACEACNIEVYEYRYDSGIYTFSPAPKAYKRNYYLAHETVPPPHLRRTMHRLIENWLSMENGGGGVPDFDAADAACDYLDAYEGGESCASA